MITANFKIVVTPGNIKLHMESEQIKENFAARKAQLENTIGKLAAMLKEIKGTVEQDEWETIMLGTVCEIFPEIDEFKYTVEVNEQ